MTKQDLNAMTKGLAVGGGIAWLIWFFLRQKATIREVSPVTVKWEGL